MAIDDAAEREEDRAAARDRELDLSEDLSAADNEVALESLSQWQLAWRRFRRHRLALVGTAIFGMMLAVGIWYLSEQNLRGKARDGETVAESGG